MTSLYRNASLVDWDDLFEPETNGNGVGDPAYKRADGTIIRYAKRAYGSAVASVGYARTDGGGDVASLWAAKGSVASLNALSINGGNYGAAASAVTVTDLLYADVQIVLNSNGTGAIVAHSTNYSADNVSAYANSPDNYPNGKTLKTFNWAKNPVAGFGAGFTVDFTNNSDDIGWIDYYVAGNSSTHTDHVSNPTLGSTTQYYYFSNGAGWSSGSPFPKGCGPARSPGVGTSRNASKDFANQTRAMTGLDLTNGVMVGSQLQGQGGSVNTYFDANGGLSWYYTASITVTIKSKTTSEQVSATFRFRTEIRWQASSYSGGGGGSSGGGGGGCVAVDSIFPDGSTAAQLRPGDYMLVTNPYLTGSETTSDGEVTLLPVDQFSGNTVNGKVLYASPETQPGLRLTTESGATLDCSTTAVIPTLEKGYQFSPNLKNLHVPVAAREDIASGATAFVWEKVTSVEPIGPLLVQKIFVQNRCFWASKDGQRFILHHNLKPTDGP